MVIRYFRVRIYYRQTLKEKQCRIAMHVYFSQKYLIIYANNVLQTISRFHFFYVVRKDLYYVRRVFGVSHSVSSQ